MQNDLKYGPCLEVVNFRRPSESNLTINHYGYDSHNGKKLSSGGEWQAYGPSFTDKDVVGCGVIEGKCFYTKNGEFLGVAFKNVPGGLCPSVGLHWSGDIVEANFGQKPFRYAIDWDRLKSLCN